MGLESSEQIHVCDKTKLQELQQQELTVLEQSLKDLGLHSSTTSPLPSCSSSEELPVQTGCGHSVGLVVVSAGTSGHVDSFLKEALNSRNRMTVLRLEQEIEKFMQNPEQQQLQFKPIPSSYDRLVAHRIAQHYGLQSTVVGCPSGSRILLLKTQQSKFPSVRLGDLPLDPAFHDKSASSPVEKVAIKQRENGTFSCNGVADRGTTRPIKTIEEREDEYDRARARIFCHGSLAYRADDESVVSSVDDMEDKPVSHSVQERILLERAAIVGGDKDRVEDDFSPKAANRVAIFRDREKDMKDPDYDRSYDRYSQRASSQIEWSAGYFPILGMCPPSLNASGYSRVDECGQPHMCLDRASFTTFHHYRGLWASSAGFAGSNGLYGSPSQGHTNFSRGSDVYFPERRFAYTGHYGYAERSQHHCQPIFQCKAHNGGVVMRQG